MAGVTLRLRFGGDVTERPAVAAVGQSLLLHLQALDADTGAAVAATGPLLLATRPDKLQLAWTASDLVADGTGAWIAAVAADIAGGWRFRASVDGPAVAVRETAATVIGTAVGGLPAAPALVTQDLAPIITQAGGVLTVTRATALPQATDPGGLGVIGVQGGVTKWAPWELLQAAANAAGSQAARDYADAADLATLQAAMSYADGVLAGAGASVVARLLGLPIMDFSDPRNAALLTL